MNEWVLQFFEIQRCVRSMWCAFIFWFEEKISVLCVRRVLLWCMFQYQYRYVEKVSSTYCTGSSTLYVQRTVEKDDDSI